ncbi:hypothetical protein [Thioclava sp. GXIMD2076]|uniref:Lipoprotein n=1 Tax=Thioclava kandeliae TaxID=3070818 RepID=A0ABV1SHA9_9RHOB
MSTKLILALGLVGFMAACAPKPAPAPMPAEPVTAEPVYHSKL